MTWKIAALKSLKFTLIVLLASSIRFVFSAEINWFVQIATAALVFLVATVIFYMLGKPSNSKK